MAAEPRFMLIMCRPRVGFLASFLQVLGELDECDREGIAPVVFFGSNWSYWRPGGYDGAINGWAYYFEPVSEYSVADVVGRDEAYLESCNIFDFPPERIIANHNPKHIYDRSREGHLQVPDNVTVVNRWPRAHFGVRSVLEERRPRARELIDKYIRLRPNVQSAVDAFGARHMRGHRVIGVHLRGRGHDTEVEGWHGLAFATERRYFPHVDRELAHDPDARVFLATDSEEALARFRRRYGGRLISFDARRSSGGNTPHLQYGGPEIGREVLIETLLLARTDLLVHGISNVAFAALCFAPALQHVDVYTEHQTRLTRALRAQRVLREPAQALRKVDRSLREDPRVGESYARLRPHLRRALRRLDRPLRGLGSALYGSHTTPARRIRGWLPSRPELAFVFVCQRGELELKATLLAATLRREMDRPCELIAAVPTFLGETHAPSDTTLQVLSALEVRVVDIENTLHARPPALGDLLLNKAFCLGVRTAADRLVFVDSDILCMRPWDRRTLVGEAPFLAKPVDVQTTCSWPDVYGLFGMAVPERRVCSTRSNEPGPPYFNSGLFAVDPVVAPQLRNLWLETYRRITDSGVMEDNPFYREQVALSVALQRARMEFGLLDETYNFPAHMREVQGPGDAVFVHYHEPGVVERTPVLRARAQSVLEEHPRLRALVRQHPAWAHLLASSLRERPRRCASPSPRGGRACSDEDR